MKIRLYKGKRIAYIANCEFQTTQLFRAFATDKAIYFLDCNGNVFKADSKTKAMTKLKESSTDNRRKRPYIRVAVKTGVKRRIYVEELVAKVMFSQITRKPRAERIGHFDGNVANNKIDNIYYDLTPREVNEFVGR